MVRSHPVRDVLISVAGVVATATGLVALTPLSWPFALISGLVVGVGVLLGDIFLFDRPVERGTPWGRRVIAVAGALVFLGAVVLSFFAGRATSSASEPYPFLVAATNGLTTLRAVPHGESGALGAVESGQVVWVDCFVSEGGKRWFKLIDEQGWLPEDEALQSPHTGRGAPPRCPD